jgi:hypothetical protein
VFSDLVRELKATEQQLVGQLEGVRGALAALEGGDSAATSGVSGTPVVRKRRRLSAKARAAISRAQKLRWAKHRMQSR